MQEMLIDHLTTGLKLEAADSHQYMNNKYYTNKGRKLIRIDKTI